MLYSFLLTILMTYPFGEKVSFTVINDSSKTININVDFMPDLTLIPNGQSELRLSKNQTVYISTTNDKERISRKVLFNVDESYEGKIIKLSKYIRKAQ